MISLKIFRYFICLICTCLFFIDSHAQQYEEMSAAELRNTLSRTEKHLKSVGRARGIMITETIIDIAEKFNTKQQYYLKASSYNLLGKIYFSSRDYEEALENFKIAELFSKELSGFNDLAIDINNNMALVYLEGFNKPGRALKRINNIYKNSSELDEYTKHLVQLNLANIYLKTEHYHKSNKLLKKCLSYFERNPEYTPKLVMTYTSIGEYYAHIRHYSKAIKNFELAASIAEKNELYRQAMVIYEKYENLLIKLGNKEKAYVILKKYTKHHQTALENEKLEADRYKKQLTVSEAKKTIETQKAQQSKTVSIFTLTLLLLCLTLFCFFVYNHKKTKVLGESLALKNKELKISKEKSDRLAAVKTKFISTVSHELRTPLYGVIGLSSILMERIKDEENHNFIKLMKFSADHLLNLINDVLQVTKMESYEIQLDESVYNIKNLANDIKNSFEYQAEKNGNTLHLNLDPNIPNMLIGDPVRLSQIFINLISNANKFTREGNIWLNFIHPKINNDTVEITFEVRDDGRGIPLEKQELIFEKFSQANSTDHTTGTGLGLNIVRKLVNLHGGDIKVKSVPNEGATFYFSIPFKIHESKDEEIAQQIPENVVSLENNTDYNILIVEDNKINQIVTQNILKTKGFISDIADDGLVAVEMVKQNHYDLVLMDLNMPNMNGMEATKKIREFNLDIPIIALTASDTKDTITEILNTDSGFCDYMRKPFKKEEFFKKINSYLATKISKAS